MKQFKIKVRVKEWKAKAICVEPNEEAMEALSKYFLKVIWNGEEVK